MPSDKPSPPFDLLEQLPTPSLTRNDPCLCGSGKKYKKCCLEKNKLASVLETEQEPSNLNLESIEIKWDPLTPEEAQNDFSPISEEDEEIMAKLHETLLEYPEMIDSEDCAYFKQLDILKAKYPAYPVILNYISGGYQCIEKYTRAEEVVIETYEKFPTYLFALTERAHIYLRKGLFEKAFEAVKGTYSIKQLYPNRTVFHVTEFKAFEHFIILYLCAINDFKQAEVHIDILKQVLDEEDPVLANVKWAFRQQDFSSHVHNNPA